jgi:predicted Co/Zn/Cd cation transporter (cation efflux family)
MEFVSKTSYSMIFVHMCKKIYWFVMYVNDRQQYGMVNDDHEWWHMNKQVYLSLTE